MSNPFSSMKIFFQIQSNKPGTPHWPTITAILSEGIFYWNMWLFSLVILYLTLVVRAAKIALGQTTIYLYFRTTSKLDHKSLQYHTSTSASLLHAPPHAHRSIPSVHPPCSNGSLFINNWKSAQMTGKATSQGRNQSLSPWKLPCRNDLGNILVRMSGCIMRPRFL